jgi:uncharacterized protein YbbC (DUF1343 family)
MRIIVFSLIALSCLTSCCTGSASAMPIKVGAERTEAYFHLLEGKRIALAGNHTSLVGGVHLVDTLLNSGFNLIKVFSPEHGFRGAAAAGEWVESGRDPKSGLPIISLYGSNRKPQPGQLDDVDLILFDIQDVGVRFYTYISTMTYLMEAAAAKGIPMIILDRPNPLGHFVDGPVLQSAHASFVGLHPIPVVHGMTIGEYALMVNGEGWLDKHLACDITVVSVANYDHTTPYSLPVPPSPNLPNMRAVYLYPSLCFFEGTAISVGRGTDMPFQVFGHPELDPARYPHRFRPQSVTAAPSPPELGNLCHGKDLSKYNPVDLKHMDKINLQYLLDAYKDFPNKDLFFNAFFEKLAGTSELRQQLMAGKSEDEIRNSWQQDLENYKTIRARYLLYSDFE